MIRTYFRGWFPNSGQRSQTGVWERGTGTSFPNSCLGTLAWKDYREQRALWLGLAMFSAFLLIMLHQFMPPETAMGSEAYMLPGMPNMLAPVGIFMAEAFGLLCGCLLLAGEKEGGTLTFLDTLEGQRRRIWKTKLAIGVMLTVAQAAWIALVLGALSYRQGFSGVLQFPLAAGLGLATLTWSFLFAALCNKVLAAAGWSAASLWLFWLVIAWFFGLRGLTEGTYYALLILQAVMSLTALEASRRLLPG